MEVALVAVLGDFSVGFGVEVLGLDGWDVADIAGDVGLGDVGCLLALLLLPVGHVAHVADDGVLFGLGLEHEVINIIDNYINLPFLPLPLYIICTSTKAIGYSASTARKPLSRRRREYASCAFQPSPPRPSLCRQAPRTSPST